MNTPGFVNGASINSFTTKLSHPTFVSTKQILNKCTPIKSQRVKTTMKVYDVEVIMEGKTHNIPIDENLTLLEGIEEYGLEVLYSCRAGVCVTCAAKKLSGEVDLGFASITDDLKKDGYVLACSAYPRSEGIKLEMNHFDDAYERQYGQYEQEEQ